MTTGWIGIDLDGTLAFDSPMSFPAIADPVPAMLTRVRGLIKSGVDVRIFTARVAIVDQPWKYPHLAESNTHFAADQEALIRAWCVKHLGRELPVTAQKDFAMVCCYDDRAVQMVTNTGQTIIEHLEQVLDQAKAL